MTKIELCLDCATVTTLGRALSPDLPSARHARSMTGTFRLDPLPQYDCPIDSTTRCAGCGTMEPGFRYTGTAR